MLKKLLNKTSKDQKGFTIIEVMIVLAIAGLILVVVLIAIPQLQRNQRNENRRSILARVKSELENYAGNNNASYPVANSGSGQNNLGSPVVTAGFFNRYLGCDGASPATCSVNINDPKTARPIGSDPGGGAAVLTTTAVAGAGATVATPGTEPGSIAYTTNAVCSGETATTTGATTRNYALQIRLEGGAIYCLTNT
jgi:prepilin-type N-terminal cleavage/methylation domain-containing protein